MNRSTAQLSTVAEGLEARLGARLAATLNERSAALPHDISERLRAGREQAVARARRAQTSARSRPATAVAGVTPAGAVMLGGKPSRFWLQLASWVPLAVLVAGLLLIQEWTDREQVLAAAEIDAVLLADDLPPAAWTDPGFREYLKAPPP